MRAIENEFKKAEHLLFVSLKYTKTGDVIRNVLDRWNSTIELSIDRLLERAKKKKKIKVVPVPPVAKAELLLKLHKETFIKEIVKLYLFFRRLDSLEKTSQSEFRKRVALKIIDNGREVLVDMDKLFEWREKVENFLEFVREKA